MKARVQVTISGVVQGVWFRASTKKQADALGLTGWVRNTDSGDVEAVFEGEETVVEEMVAWCRRGPSLAQVSEVVAKKQRFSGEFASFTIRRE